MSGRRTKVTIALLLMTGLIPLAALCLLLYPLMLGGHRDRVKRQVNAYADIQAQRIEDLLARKAGEQPVVSSFGQEENVWILEFDAREWNRLLRSDAALGSSAETLIAQSTSGGGLRYLVPANVGGRAVAVYDGLERDLMFLAAHDSPGNAVEASGSGGEELIAATRFIPGANLAVLVRLDRREAFAEANRLAKMALIAPAVALALAGLMSVILARRPLLSQTAETERTRDLEAQIAESRVAQIALAESEERFALAVAGSNEGIWDWDIASNDVYFAPRFKELLGFQPGELANDFDAWTRRLHPRDKDVTLAALRNHLETGQAYDVEYRLRCADGAYKWFRGRGLAVRDANGNPTRMAGSITDITNRKKAEEELLRSNEELEQFAHIASHDLQEPIRTVSSYVQLFARRYQGKVSAEADEYIGFIIEGADRMRQLIRGLLVYARAGTRDKDFGPVDTGEILKNALKNLKVAIEESHAKIAHDEMPVVHGDAVQITQLFQNLISNSIKFRGENPPEIHIGAKLHDGAWRFSVRDNGIGIDPKHQERIFLIFQRLHTREAYAGTGIGLSVCKRIVARHDGSIWVDSSPGHGATFGFTLPVAAFEGPQAESAPAVASQPGSTPQPEQESGQKTQKFEETRRESGRKSISHEVVASN